MASSVPGARRKVRVLSCDDLCVARVLAVMCGTLGFIAAATAPFWFLGRISNPGMSPGLIWLVALVFMTFGGFFVGYVAGGFLAACLNMALQLAGGIEIEVVQEPDSPPRPIGDCGSRRH